MNTRRAAPAAITILLAILGGALISADEPPAPLFDDIVEAPAAVTERADGIGKDIQDAAAADLEATEPERPAEPVGLGDVGGLPSNGRPSASGSRPGEDPDRAEMLLRLSSPDFISGIRMKFGEEDVKKILDAMRKSNPDVTFEIDGNTIIARGSVADLSSLRSSLLTLGQTEDAKDWPPGLQVDVDGWRAPGGVSPEPAAPEKTTIIQLEHLPASHVANMLTGLFPAAGRIVAEPLTNTLILRGTSEQLTNELLADVKAIVVRLETMAQERREDQSSGGRGTASTAQTFESAARQPDPEIRVFLLRHVLAEELAPTLRELFAENIKVTVNDRTNSLLVNAPPETLGRIEDLVRQLDQPADTTAVTGRSDAAKPRAAAEAEYAAAERQAAALALRLKQEQELRDVRERIGATAYSDTTGFQKEQDLRDARRLADTKSVLRKLVSEAFDKRQLHQRTELELLRAELWAIQHNIDRRERIRKEIIDRRVEELLKPELRWEPDEPPAALDDDGLGATPVPPPLDGIVTAVGNGNLIEISLGSDDGLRVGHHLEVFRDNTYLGHAVVQRTDPDGAVAKVDDKTKRGTIKVRDRVATKLSPAKSPLTAVLWIEAVFEVNGDNGPTEMVYMNGTAVSPDGLIAVALPPGDDPMKRLKSAKVYLDDSRIVEGRLVAYDAASGLGLVRVEAEEIPFLALSGDSLAANRQLRMYAMRVSAGGQKDRWSEEVRVERWEHGPDRSSRHDRLAPWPGSGRITTEHAGAALVSTDGQLEGIVAVEPALSDPDARPSVRILSAAIVRKLLAEAVASRTGSRPAGGADADSPRSAAESRTDKAWQLLGLRLARLPGEDSLAGKPHNGGMQVIDVRRQSPAETSGTRKGDILIGLHNWETLSDESVEHVLDHLQLENLSRPKFYILRDGETLTGHLQIP